MEHLRVPFAVGDFRRGAMVARQPVEVTVLGDVLLELHDVGVGLGLAAAVQERGQLYRRRREHQSEQRKGCGNRSEERPHEGGTEDTREMGTESCTAVLSVKPHMLYTTPSRCLIKSAGLKRPSLNAHSEVWVVQPTDEYCHCGSRRLSPCQRSLKTGTPSLKASMYPRTPLLSCSDLSTGMTAQRKNLLEHSSDGK